MANVWAAPIYTWGEAPAVPGIGAWRAEVSGDRRPLLPPGLFLYGPPGVGKTGVCVLSIQSRAACLAERTDMNGFVERGLNRWAFREELAQRFLDNGGDEEIGELWYERWPKLTRKLLTLPIDERAHYETRLLSVPDLLCLDEVSSGTVTEWKESLLCEIVDRPYAGLPTLIAMNSASVDAVVAAVGVRIADRLFDSQAYRAIELTGASRRGEGT